MTNPTLEKPSQRLLALSTAAMALPALTTLRRGFLPNARSAIATQVQRDEHRPKKISSINAEEGGGSNQRYDIDINQYAFSTPGRSFLYVHRLFKTRC